MPTNLGALTATINGFPLNVQNDDGTRVSLESFIGWGSAPAIVQVVNKGQAHGAWVGKSFNGPRSFTLAGKVHGTSIESLAAKVDELIGAFAAHDVPLIVNEGAVTRQVMVRREGDVLTEWATSKIARWSAQVLAPDPRKTGTPLVYTTGLPGSTGGVTFPFAFPFAFSETATSGRVTLTNPGTAPGRVRLRITAGVGGLTSPSVTHLASGAVLQFATSLTIPNGNWVDVDMEAQTVMENGQPGATRNGWVTGRGWSFFEPGVNEWAFNAVTGLGTLQVTAIPAWW